jgi:hypothetical protein
LKFFLIRTILVLSHRFLNNNMEITGKIIAVLPARGGTSARTGNEWKSQEFVIETHDQYPKKCVFTVFGVDRLAQFNIQSGEELVVSFDIDAHDYNGRWFNDIRAWKVERVSDQQAASSAQQPAPVGMEGQPVQAPQAPFPPATDAPSESVDDLPF